MENKKTFRGLFSRNRNRWMKQPQNVHQEKCFLISIFLLIFVHFLLYSVFRWNSSAADVYPFAKYFSLHLSFLTDEILYRTGQPLDTMKYIYVWMFHFFISTAFNSRRRKNGSAKEKIGGKKKKNMGSIILLTWIHNKSIKENKSEWMKCHSYRFVTITIIFHRIWKRRILREIHKSLKWQKRKWRFKVEADVDGWDEMRNFILSRFIFIIFPSCNILKFICARQLIGKRFKFYSLLPRSMTNKLQKKEMFACLRLINISCHFVSNLKQTESF